MIAKDDYIINWKDTSKKINNLIRGLYPNAYCLINGKRIKIIDSYIIKKENESEQNRFNLPIKSIYPGKISYSTDKTRLIVGTGDGFLIIYSAKLEGKNILYGKDLCNRISSMKCTEFSSD